MIWHNFHVLNKYLNVLADFADFGQIRENIYARKVSGNMSPRKFKRISMFLLFNSMLQY